MTKLQDRIARTIDVHAPIERVFREVREDMLGKTVGDLATDSHVVHGTSALCGHRWERPQVFCDRFTSSSAQHN
jgi:hypothetical protein